MVEKTISEYGYVGCDNVPTNNKFVGIRDLEPKLFKELYNFWLEDKETQKIFTFENKQCLKATSYVGIIQTKNLSIEILPKIYNNVDEDSIRKIFTEMLKPLLDINEVQINKADLSVTKNKNIYEMFITMFVKYLDTLIHKGLKSQYISKEDNQFFLKGKLKFNQHIKQNYIHKERFYVEFDEYLPNRVENRLLKSTIQLLLKKTHDYENKRALRQQLFIFDEVQLSTNYDIDISKINLHRGMEYYEMPLRFAKVFLKHQSFSSLRGNDNVFALLFPMETVFEKYMEFVLNNSKEILGIDKVMVNGGKNEYLLSNGDCKMARLEPDYLLKMKDGRKDIVTDAKWKLFEENIDENKNCSSVNILSNDVYQIFAYLNFYDCADTAYLFVPKIKELEAREFKYNINSNINIIGERYRNFRIKIIPIDLADTIKKNHKLTNKTIKEFNHTKNDTINLTN
jgi:5-methylcytosine-specific restriction enzyme subunit McrC